jgi:hypothetical protein
MLTELELIAPLFLPGIRAGKRQPDGGRAPAKARVTEHGRRDIAPSPGWERVGVREGRFSSETQAVVRGELGA